MSIPWPQPLPDNVRDHWLLERETTFINHGSFGACPKPVLAYQDQIRAQLEAQPMRFFNSEYNELMAAMRVSLGKFVGADPDGFAMVPNATAATNMVLRSLEFAAGDELVTTNHEYQAVRNAMDFVAKGAGAQVIAAPIPFPIRSSEQALDAVLSKITSKTKLVVVDHVTSPTGLILPVAQIAAACAQRDIPVLVDGAHGPGMLELNLEDLGVAFYAANCHKWLCTPKGSAFLWTRADWRERIRPLAISHGATAPLADRYRHEADWPGTHDPSAVLSIPTAIKFLSELLPGGITALQQHNHQMVVAARQLLLEHFGTQAAAPENMLGSTASVRLQPDPAGDHPGAFGDPLQMKLQDEHNIAVPVFPNPSGGRLVRVSAQAYNVPADYQRLVEVFGQLGISGV